MRHPVDPTVLRRKIAAHARPQAGSPDLRPLASRGLSRALRRAATPFEGLDLVPGQVVVTTGVDLDGAIAALPDAGLCAALEDDAGRRGLLALSPGMVDALVEVQTTGRVEATPLPARAVTRIDEALARDFIDLMLAAFAQETGAVAGRDWPERMAYGSRVRDQGQISLLLPDAAHTVLSVEVGLGGADRRTRLVLVLPRIAPVASAGAAAPVRALDPRWVAARARLVDMLQLPLDVVLMRTRRPLGEVEALGVGDLLPFASADLQKVSLETDDGRILVHGRLGQMGGRRAFRLAPPAGFVAGAGQRTSAAGPDFGSAAGGGIGSGMGADMGRELDLQMGLGAGGEPALGLDMGIGAGSGPRPGSGARPALVPGLASSAGMEAGMAAGFGPGLRAGLEIGPEMGNETGPEMGPQTGPDGWPALDPFDTTGTQG